MKQFHTNQESETDLHNQKDYFMNLDYAIVVITHEPKGEESFSKGTRVIVAITRQEQVFKPDPGME